MVVVIKLPYVDDDMVCVDGIVCFFDVVICAGSVLELVPVICHGRIGAVGRAVYVKELDMPD